MELPMDLLISKLIGPQASHDAASLNKAVSLSLKHCHPSSVTGMFQVCCANGFRFASHLGDLCFHSSDLLHISIHLRTTSLFRKMRYISHLSIYCFGFP